MAKRPLLMVHGWSASSKSLNPLSAFLKNAGLEVVDIWLADYLSMNDEITIYDIGQAMGKAVEDNKISQEPHSFDVVVHSTGGLVVRQYLLHYFGGRPRDCPIRHLLMLAPANFGSPLAHLGKSIIGRLRVGWDWDHFWQSGRNVLGALELASPISWSIARQDLFNPKNKLFTPENVYTTVLVGTDAYTSSLAGALHENGSDGTVRVSTANLNAAYIKMVFTERGFEVSPQKKCYSPIAFGVPYGHNHGTIIDPRTWDDRLKEIVLRSLRITGQEEYGRHIKDLDRLTGETFARGVQEEGKAVRHHHYQHVVTRVHDQFGGNIEDYFIEFYQERGDQEDKVLQKIQAEILEKVKTYSREPGYRSFLFDVTDMKKEILDKGHRVDMSLCAAALSDRVFYLDPKRYFTVVSEDDQTLLQPDTTLLVDIELPRLQSKDVFKLRR
jgi:pimeloyl-ACP methyl ester carboxylesterase